MSKKIILLHTIFICINVFSQKTPDFGTIDSHEYYVSQLASSKDQGFQEVIAQYEKYIKNHPQNVIAQIELCKYIGNSYWDEYEDYNLKYEETEACIEKLTSKYPKNSNVLIYRAQNSYGDDKLEILNTAKELIKTDRTNWLNHEIAAINEMLGDYHQEEKSKALQFYKKAQRLNDSLDLSYAIAEIYESQGKDELAREILLPNLEKDTIIWVMNQKANLLLKLDEPEKALHLFDIIGERDSTYINNEEMAKAMTDLGKLTTAREFLVRDTLGEWRKLDSKQLLFIHDLKYSNGEVALKTYRNLQNENSYDDFFGVKRLRLFIKNPLLSWTPSEVFHLLLLYGLVLLVFLVPYLWVLPIYGLGDLLRKSGISVKKQLNFNWGIKHFWLVSFFYLFASVVTLLVFGYQENINHYFDLGVYGSEEVNTKQLSNEMILFVFLMATSTLLVLGKKRIKYVFRTNSSIGQMIGLSILFVVFNRILIKFLGLYIDLEDNASTILFLNAKEEILAVISQQGFLAAILMTAVIVPIYEEIIFRGVILGSVEKYVGFKGANVIQAILFAAVHDDLALFPFFFVFALITGYWVKRSGGLLTGIFFHGIHNFSIVAALYFISKISGLVV